MQKLFRRIRMIVIAAILLVACRTEPRAALQSGPITVEQILGFPSPENLTTSPSGSAIA